MFIIIVCSWRDWGDSWESRGERGRVKSFGGYSGEYGFWVIGKYRFYCVFEKFLLEMFEFF